MRTFLMLAAMHYIKLWENFPNYNNDWYDPIWATVFLMLMLSAPVADFRDAFGKRGH